MIKPLKPSKNEQKWTKGKVDPDKHVKVSQTDVAQCKGIYGSIWALLIMAICIVLAIKTDEKRAQKDKRWV